MGNTTVVCTWEAPEGTEVQHYVVSVTPDLLIHTVVPSPPLELILNISVEVYTVNISAVDCNGFESSQAMLIIDLRE